MINTFNRIAYRKHLTLTFFPDFFNFGVMGVIALTKLHTIYSLQRMLFRKMVLDLCRSPGESLILIALCLWLQEIGYPNVILKLLVLHDTMLDKALDETVLYLRYLASQFTIGPPQITTISASEDFGFDICLQMLFQYKYTTISAIKRYLRTVCSYVFTDLLYHASPDASYFIPYQIISIPGFPHPIFGSLNIRLWPMDHIFYTQGLWPWCPMNQVDADDRSLFITFSKGFPVSDQEIRELFTKIFGDCVDIVDLANTKPNQQPLFARLVLRTVEMVDHILQGKVTAKFQINGKHVWARKYRRGWGRRKQ
ncbi:hypothetical protein Dimus_010264 [Dionaea muscipula]